MTKRVFLYFLLAFVIGCAPAQNVKKSSTENPPKKKESEAKKSYNIGFSYLQMKMYEDALTNFEKAIKDSSTYVDAYLALGKVYIKTQQYGLAEQTYNHLIEKVPKTVKGWSALGALYVKLKRFDDAINAYEKAKGINDKDENVYFGLGFVYEQMKDYTKAQDIYLKAHNLAPDNRAITYALGKIYLKLKKPDLKEFGTIYIKEARAYEGLHQYSLAAESYLKAIEKSENKIIPYKNLINMYLKIKNYSKAQKYITNALSISPGDPVLLCMSGDIYIGFGDTARSRARKTQKKKDFERAISYYGTAKSWYKKAIGKGNIQWENYARKGIKIADAKIKNTKQEMWY
ncbi:MAG: hypothetical protein B5M53_10020 [Candidatus Cloacimonas sp. 4484_209]|nr:MAG: hypothetical protein B5M53_10020 [Candidatus Cloacimonas sp. 4484_209]